MQPLIAITAREIIIDEPVKWKPLVYGQWQPYIEAVVRAEGIPIIVPYINNETALRQLYEKTDGLLLCGGLDVDPNHYQAKLSPLTECGSEWCDKQELCVLKWALADKKPILGVCRGMQLINVALGGSLYQDISTDLPNAQDHQLSEHRKEFNYLAHNLKIEPGSKLAKILSTGQIKTNALHHQAVDRLGDSLIASAHSEDGVVEAIELPGSHFVVGIQSHPEALAAQTEPLWQKLFVEFVKSAKQ